MKYAIDDDSFAAIQWRSKRWADRPTLRGKHGLEGPTNAEVSGHTNASRASFDRALLIAVVLDTQEEVRMFKAAMKEERDRAVAAEARIEDLERRLTLLMRERKTT